MVKAALVGLVTLALVGPVSAAPEPTPENKLEGVYACEGTNPDGKTYNGIVEIAKLKDAYFVRWTMPDDSQVVGVGILTGNQLSVSYYGGTPAVVVYAISEDGRLNGKWTAGGADGALFSETLTRMPEGKPAKPTKRESNSRPQVTV